MWKAAAAVKDEWREGLASGGETFLEKSFSPEPPFPKAFDWWGGRAEGVRSDMRGTFMGGPSTRLHLWDVADRDAISVKAFEEKGRGVPTVLALLEKGEIWGAPFSPRFFSLGKRCPCLRLNAAFPHDSFCGQSGCIST